MSNSAPKISVCIPTYNQAHFLGDAIGSVLGQTRSDFELIVVDNCSTDGTADAVDQFIARDRRIRYFRNSENLGAQRNFNRCLELASGEYVKFLCSDDLLEPACIERTAAILAGNPNVSLVSSARMNVDEALHQLGTKGYSSVASILPGASVITRCLERGNIIGEPSAVMFRRDQAGRGFDTRYRQLVDLEFWFHLLEQGDFAFVPDALCRIRQHPGQDTVSFLQSFSAMDDEFRLYDEYIGKPFLRLPLSKRMWAKYRTAALIMNMNDPSLDEQVLKQKVTTHYGGLQAGLLLAARLLLKPFAMSRSRSRT